jgi:hypothetical protein
MKTVIQFVRIGVCSTFALLALAACGGGNDGDDNQSVLTSITLSSTAASIETGATQAFTATARDQAGNTMTGMTFTWSSSNTAVATVNASGTATGAAAGTANISASAAGVTSPAAVLTVVQAAQVSGTAAQGAPITGATLTLKDSAGTTRTATTGADGRFTVSTTGLEPPFLLQVQAGAGETLYSVSADANVSGTINVTPLTDLIVRSWYSVKGTDVDDAFASTAANPPPSPDAVELISRVVVQVVQLWLDDAGVDSATFNPIASSFTADHTGADLVLDRMTVNTDTGMVELTDGATTQSSEFSYDSDAGAMSVQTTTSTQGGATSSSTTHTVVPVSNDEVAAVTAIEGTLAAFANTVNTEGANLTAAALLPFTSAEFLDQGMDRDQFAASVAEDLAGATITLELRRIDMLDLDAGRAAVTFDVRIVAGEQIETSTFSYWVRKVDQSWLLDGDQRLGSISVHAEMRTDQGMFAQDPAPSINVHVQAPDGTVTGATVTGGEIWQDAALTHGADMVDEEVRLDNYFINSGPLASLLPAGTPFTLTLARSTGGSASYTLETNAFTTEAISITSPTGSTLADAQLGQTLNVEWSLPHTYPIASIQLHALVFTGDSNDPNTLQCEADGQLSGLDATSGTLVIPATCGGQPVVQANINLSVDGVNGERNQVIYGFE